MLVGVRARVKVLSKHRATMVLDTKRCRGQHCYSDGVSEHWLWVLQHDHVNENMC